MSKSQQPLTDLLLPIALVAVFLIPASASAQKKVKYIGAYAPPTLVLSSDATIVSECAGNAAVQLNARAASPDGNPIKYHWTTTGGRISGYGPAVTWDLTGVSPGIYKASIKIETGNIDGECEAFTSTTVAVKTCPPVIQPSCPVVEISCPTNIGINQPLTFSARVSGGNPPVPPVYNWTVSAGTIVEGQGTSSIRVDTTGLAGETVKATLSMGGYTIDCSANCSASVPLPSAKCRKFDEFPEISRNDEKARLDNYAVEIQNDPTSTAYVVIYPNRAGKSAIAQRHSAQIVDYLVNSRGIDARRIVTLVGGARDPMLIELWSCPQGATPPKP
jgi:hypothetical protein